MTAPVSISFRDFNKPNLISIKLCGATPGYNIYIINK